MALLAITVVYSPRAGCVDEVELSLPAGSSVADALRASGLAERHPGLDMSSGAVGVWGRAAAPGRMLRERDRVEVYRPLTVDPKEARRLRQQNQRRR